MTGVLTLDDAVATAATGDIWLFRGRSLADRAIQAMTNSPVNHVGMVVALDDMPPLMWHAELGRSLPDVWTGERQRGVQLHVLRDAVRTWDEHYGQRAWMRRLEGTIDPRARGPADRGDRALRRQAVPDHAGPRRARGSTGRVRRREVSRETVYCAELVAAPTSTWACCPSRRPSSWYDPGQVLERRPDRHGAAFALGPEIAIDV